MLEASFVRLEVPLQTPGMLTLDVRSSRLARQRIVPWRPGLYLHLCLKLISLAVCDAHPIAVSHRCFVCGEVWGDWILSPIGKSFERRLNLSGS